MATNGYTFCMEGIWMDWEEIRICLHRCEFRNDYHEKTSTFKSSGFTIAGDRKAVKYSVRKVESMFTIQIDFIAKVELFWWMLPRHVLVRGFSVRWFNFNVQKKISERLTEHVSFFSFVQVIIILDNGFKKQIEWRLFVLMNWWVYDVYALKSFMNHVHIDVINVRLLSFYTLYKCLLIFFVVAWIRAWLLPVGCCVHSFLITHRHRLRSNATCSKCRMNDMCCALLSFACCKHFRWTDLWISFIFVQI